MTDNRFPKTLRLRTSAEFDRVYKTRVIAADDVLILHVAPSELPHPRLGLSVSRKAGNAVVRNRWKRCLREAFRLQRGEIPNLDLIARPQKGAQPDCAAIFRSLPQLARRAARKLSAQRLPDPPHKPEAP